MVKGKFSIVLALLVLLASPSLAQFPGSGRFGFTPGRCPQTGAPRIATPRSCPQTRQVTRPRPCPQTRVHQAARPRLCPNTQNRPTRTQGGVPIRYVNVPVPAYVNNPAYGYGYGYGAYGYGFSGGTAAPIDPSINRSRTRRRAARRDVKPAPVDPRTARDYRFRKKFNSFCKENSVGGKLYLASGSKKWLLDMRQAPQFNDSGAQVECLGKVRGGHQQRVLLSLVFNEQGTVEALVKPL